MTSSNDKMELEIMKIHKRLAITHEFSQSMSICLPYDHVLT